MTVHCLHYAPPNLEYKKQARLVAASDHWLFRQGKDHLCML